MKKLLLAMVMLFICMTAFSQSLRVYEPKRMQPGELYDQVRIFDIYHIYQGVDGELTLGTQGTCKLVITNYGNLLVEYYVDQYGVKRLVFPGDYVLLSDMDNDVLIISTRNNDFYFVDFNRMRNPM